MTATGIGAAVRRKEDQRFITGKGHYTDDVLRPGQSFAFFIRSPALQVRICECHVSKYRLWVKRSLSLLDPVYSLNQYNSQHS